MSRQINCRSPPTQASRINRIATIPDKPVSLQNESTPIDEDSGKLSNSLNENDSLMKTVMENDQEAVKDGKILNDMINQGLSAFQPDMTFNSMVQNYKNAKNIYGESMLMEATGHSSSQIERNIKLPEFQRDIKSRMHSKARELQDKGLLGKSGEILDQGMKMAALSLYVNELDNITPKGNFGDHEHRKRSRYGGVFDVKPYSRGDRFKDIAIKHSVKTALRRGHKKLIIEDLSTSERHAKGEICIVYGIDASGSMRGKKIEVAKKAGVALAHKATTNKDKVGIMIFADHIIKQVAPTTDFFEILASITTITAAQQTDIAKTIESSIQLFPSQTMTKHLILLTDAEATVGDDPKMKALHAASMAAANDITISIIGIKLDEETTKFARQIAEVGNGKLYVVDSLEQLDKIILYDYDQLR